jgi:methanogenic corrinoid protein MtbC1
VKSAVASLSNEKGTNFTLSDFEESIIGLDTEKATIICKELKASFGVEKVFDAIERALDIVGQKYENGEYFLSELIMAGEVVKEALKLVDTTNFADSSGKTGTVVLATVKGDIHDIGKNIVAMLLRSSSFGIIDLGTDVSAEDIVDSAKERGARILGLSALLTTSVPEFGKVANRLRSQGLKEHAKIIVGGAAVSEKMMEYGVDAWAKTAVDGVRTCRDWATRGVTNES